MGDCCSRPRMANSRIVVALRLPFDRCIETMHRGVNVALPGGARRTPADVAEPPREPPGLLVRPRGRDRTGWAQEASRRDRVAPVTSGTGNRTVTPDPSVTGVP